MTCAGLVLLLALALSGCASIKQASTERWAARDDAQCQSYGAQPGSPEYVQCRATTAAARKQANAAIASHNR